VRHERISGDGSSRGDQVKGSGGSIVSTCLRSKICYGVTLGVEVRRCWVGGRFHSDRNEKRRLRVPIPKSRALKNLKMQFEGLVLILIDASVE